MSPKRRDRGAPSASHCSGEVSGSVTPEPIAQKERAARRRPFPKLSLPVRLLRSGRGGGGVRSGRSHRGVRSSGGVGAGGSGVRSSGGSGGRSVGGSGVRVGSGGGGVRSSGVGGRLVASHDRQSGDGSAGDHDLAEGFG